MLCRCAGGWAVSSDAVTACWQSIWAKGELDTDRVRATASCTGGCAGMVLLLLSGTPVVSGASAAGTGSAWRAAGGSPMADAVVRSPADLLRLWWGLGPGPAAAAASTRHCTAAASASNAAATAAAVLSAVPLSLKLVCSGIVAGRAAPAAPASPAAPEAGSVSPAGLGTPAGLYTLTRWLGLDLPRGTNPEVLRLLTGPLAGPLKLQSKTALAAAGVLQQLPAAAMESAGRESEALSEADSSGCSMRKLWPDSILHSLAASPGGRVRLSASSSASPAFAESAQTEAAPATAAAAVGAAEALASAVVEGGSSTSLQPATEDVVA